MKIDEANREKHKSRFSKGSVVLAAVGGALFVIGHATWIAFLAAAALFLILSLFFSSLFS